MDQIQKLDAQIEALKARRDRFEALLQDTGILEAFATDISGASQDNTQDITESQDDVARRIVIACMSERDGAVRTGDIRDALEERGISVQNLREFLESMPEITSAGRGWWRLRKKGGRHG